MTRGNLIERGSRGQRAIRPAVERAAAASRDDVDRLYRLLLEMGATILDPPADYPQYAPVYYAVFFADADGLKLELVHMIWAVAPRVRAARHGGQLERDARAHL